MRLTLFVVFFLGAQLWAQGDDAAMQAMMKHAMPGDQHKMMAGMVGSYTAEMTIWFAPGAPPQKVDSSAEYSMEMGGRYLKQSFSAMYNGMPLTGMGFTGYDNTLKKYISIWFDSMGTGMAFGEGDYDASKDLLEISGHSTDPISGKKAPYRFTLQGLKNKDHVFSMYSPGPDGKEFKSVEIKYTRK